jgi:hypothetical protein
MYVTYAALWDIRFDHADRVKNYQLALMQLCHCIEDSSLRKSTIDST